MTDAADDGGTSVCLTRNLRLARESPRVRQMLRRAAGNIGVSSAGSPISVRYIDRVG